MWKRFSEQTNHRCLVEDFTDKAPTLPRIDESGQRRIRQFSSTMRRMVRLTPAGIFDEISTETSTSAPGRAVRCCRTSSATVPMSRPAPLPEREAKVVDKTFQGAVGPHGALDVHLLHDVFGELDPARTWCDVRGMDGFNQALFVEIAAARPRRDRSGSGGRFDAPRTGNRPAADPAGSGSAW